jgi:hypothetical protein
VRDDRPEAEARGGAVDWRRLVGVGFCVEYLRGSEYVLAIACGLKDVVRRPIVKTGVSGRGHSGGFAA